MKKIYFLLADGFEETEFITPWDLLIRAGGDVVTAAIGDSLEVTGAHGLKLKADTLLSNITAEGCQMAVLPGGGKGTENLKASHSVSDFIKQVYSSGNFVCAICAAPTVLGQLGLLDGVEAICFPGMESGLKNAVVSHKTVVRHGNIITAAAMGVSLNFGLELVKALYGEDTARDIAQKTVSEYE